MSHLGTIDGTGRLLAAGKDVGEVDYTIDAFQVRVLIDYSGRLSGEPATINAAMGNPKALKLQLQSNEQVTILPTHWGRFDGTMAFDVADQVPGLVF